MAERNRHKRLCILAGLLLCGCGQPGSPEPQQIAWETALRQAIADAAPAVSGFVPQAEWDSTVGQLPVLLEQAAEREDNAANLRSVTWERQTAAGGNVLTLRLTYLAAPQELARRQAALTAYTEGWAAQHSMLAPEIRVLLAHDAVIRSCTYSVGAECSTAFGALLCGRASCGGYAAAFRALCSAAGIPCFTVRGTVCNAAGENVPHVWNLVELAGCCYHVDCTWDARTCGPPQHAWFLRSDAEMEATHTWDRRSVPESAGGTLSYHSIVAEMRHCIFRNAVV